jgi:purine catabolism regulator
MANSDDLLSLGELLELGDWGLELRSGGDEALARPVSGVHSIEIEYPSYWLSRNWVMLTTGIRLRGNCDRQRELVEELCEAGVSALGFGTGLTFQEIPEALLAAARARSFPVFAIPAPTPFREIVTAASRFLLSSDLRSFQRLASIQRFLVDTLQEPNPRDALIARLAKILDASVFLVSADGEVEGDLADPVAKRLTQAVAGSPSVAREMELDGWHMFVAPLRDRDDVLHGWLVAADKRGSLLNSLTRPVIESAVGPLMAVARLRQIEFDQRRAVRAAVLEELLSPQAVGVAAAKARALGLDPDEPAQAIVITPCDEQSDFDAARSRRLVEELEQWAVDAHVPFLISVREREIVGLVGTVAAPLREFLESLSDRDPTVLIGLGRTVEALADLPQAYLDARQAVRRSGRIQKPDGRVLGFESLDLGSLLMSETSEDRVRPKLDQILGVLRENPPLQEALVTFFDHEMDVTRSAEALFLHPNSLRYRLRRIEELLGRSLKDPATITSLYIALTADRHSPQAEPALVGAGEVAAPAISSPV